MLTLAGNVVLWVIVGLAVGWVIAWLWRSRMMGNKIALLQNEFRAKYEQLKRDLDGRIAGLEDELSNSKDLIQARDTAVAESDRLLRQQTAQLADRAGQIVRLTAESADQQTRLGKQKASYATLEQDHRAARALIGEQDKRIAADGAKLAALDPVPARLTATKEKLAQTLKNLESAQALVNTQDREISRLHKRTVELEPLTIAVRDRETKLSELEGRLAEAVRIRETEIMQLKKRLAEAARKIEANDDNLRNREAQVDKLEPLIDSVAGHSARALELECGIKQREQQLVQKAREIAELRAELLRWTSPQ